MDVKHRIDAFETSVYHGDAFDRDSLEKLDLDVMSPPQRRQYLKSVLGVLDTVLAESSEDAIEAFAESRSFETYGRLLEHVGLTQGAQDEATEVEPIFEDFDPRPFTQESGMEVLSQPEMDGLLTRISPGDISTSSDGWSVAKAPEVANPRSSKMIIPRFVFLQQDEQLLLDSFTRRWTVDGPGRVLVPPLVSMSRRNGVTLSATEFTKIRNSLTGEVRVEAGPKLVFLGPYEAVSGTFHVFVLRLNEYMRILDRSTGRVRTEVGEKNVILGAYEEALEEPRAGINLDEHTAVVVRKTRDGSLTLCTEQRVFFPADDEEIEAVRKKILLEKHETVIIQDKDGAFRFVRGSDPGAAFFLAPYERLLELRWSSGLLKKEKNLTIQKIDSRPKFMWYEFEVRSKDNVELVLGITFFWQIVDVQKMVQSTDDAPGDVCSHARSMIIQSVSKANLDVFLEKSGDIINASILGTEDQFYADRGVGIHSVEVRSIICKVDATQNILQEIIQETTNRLNKLQKQESENEVEMNKLQGRIESEKQRSALIALESENKKREAQIVGESEALRVKAFFEGLGQSMGDAEKVRVFDLLKKESYIEKLSRGNARMYFTPNDVNLSIETSDRN